MRKELSRKDFLKALGVGAAAIALGRPTDVFAGTEQPEVAHITAGELLHDPAKYAKPGIIVETTANLRFSGSTPNEHIFPNGTYTTDGEIFGYNLYDRPDYQGRSMLMLEVRTDEDLKMRGIPANERLAHIRGTVQPFPVYNQQDQIIGTSYELRASEVKDLRASK